MHNVETSRLQKLALQCVDKISTLVDNNEKALGLRTGSLRDRDDDDGYEDKGGRKKRGNYRNDQDEGDYRRDRKWKGHNRSLVKEGRRAGRDWDRQRKQGYGSFAKGGRNQQGDGYSRFQRRKERDTPREMATLSRGSKHY